MAQHASGITTELMEEPHVAGHRVSVRRIRALVEERGLDPRAVADSLGLGVTDIYRALAYYHEHPREMREFERQREQRIEASRERGAPTGPADL